MNPDTLRKAVELADGFEWYQSGSMADPGDIQEWIRLPDGPHSVNVKHVHQIYLDALAAQLVRQVDFLPNIFMSLRLKWSEVISRSPRTRSTENRGRVIGRGFGSDRTESTITAIVESEVLEDE